MLRHTVVPLVRAFLDHHMVIKAFSNKNAMLLPAKNYIETTLHTYRPSGHRDKQMHCGKQANSHGQR